MEDLLGKWVMMKGQQFAGLWFEFHPDGRYTSELPGLIKVRASGTYTSSPDGLVEMDQSQHSMGMVGKFLGRYQIQEDGTLLLAFAQAPGGPRPDDLTSARRYEKA